MPEPIVFISHSTIREGKLDELRRVSEDVFSALEAEKPGTVLHYGYLDSGESEVHFVHVFPDAVAMDAHMEGAAQRVASANELLETKAFEIYGTPSPAVVDALGQNPSVELTIHSDGFGGYIRLAG